jgi:tRNA nucleotidyltransferase/poly(A) polymerase
VVADADVAVTSGSAVTAGRAFADYAGGALVVLGKERLARVHLPSMVVDFTPLRGRGIVSDLRRRDFTINAIAVPIPWGPAPKFVDPTEGRRDLEAGRLRMAYPGAFRDDPVRLWRAHRLGEEFGLMVDPATRKRIMTDARRAGSITAERLRDELFKLLRMPCSGRALGKALKSGVLCATFPEFTPMGRVRIPGGSIDVLDHTLEAVRNLDRLAEHPRTVFGREAKAVTEHLAREPVAGRSRLSLLKLAVLLHDIAKPDTVGRDRDGDVHFYGHEAAGAKRAADVMRRRLKCAEDEIAVVTGIIRLHLRPGYLAAAGKMSDRAAYRLIRDAGNELYELILHAQADRMATHHGRAVTAASQRRVVTRILAFRRDMLARTPVKRLLTGNDVMREFGLPPGPQVGEALRAVEEGVALGSIRTKEEALKAAKRALDRSRIRVL